LLTSQAHKVMVFCFPRIRLKCEKGALKAANSQTERNVVYLVGPCTTLCIRGLQLGEGIERPAYNFCSKYILLVEWFLIRLCSRLGNLRSPVHQHFWCQKYFAGRMVSNQTLFAVRQSPESGSSALLVLEIFRGRMVSRRVEGRVTPEGTVGLFLEVEGRGPTQHVIPERHKWSTTWV
jgi:hypothetical protein